MKAITESAHIENLGTVLKASGDNRDNSVFTGDLLRILEWRKTKNSVPVYYIRSAASARYLEMDKEEKISYVMNTWANALRQVLRGEGDCKLLEQLSPTLHQICYPKLAPNAQASIARTLRMLLLLDVLLLGPKCSAGNPYQGIWGQLRIKDANSAKTLEKTITRLKAEHSPLQKQSDSSDSTDDLAGWSVSLPLLLIVAVAESQCEREQPFTWEAYSAGRAHEELRRLWGNIDKRVLNMIALLIRHQSAVGQYIRGSSEGSVFRFVGNASLCFESREIFDLLILLAIVQEARNQNVPGHSSKSNDYLNPDKRQKWGKSAKFSKRVHDYLQFKPEKCPTTGPTWAYFSPKSFAFKEGKQEEKDIQAFKKTIKEQALRKEALVWEDFEVISIGLDQAKQPLQGFIGKVVQGWSNIAHKDQGKRFERYFDLRVLEVPNPFIAHKAEKEKTLRVVLKDYLAAECNLFPTKWESPSPSSAIPPIAEKNHTAGDLFVHLLEIAKKKMQLEKDTRWETSSKPLYVPFPLVRRITEIVQRLMPDQCYRIPLNIDSTTKWIYIPHGIKNTNEHTQAKRVLANFLLATVLNRAMASGIRYVEIDLQNLSTLPASKNEFTRPKDWQDLVSDIYKKEGYEKLLGHYIRDINTQRDNIVFKTRLALDMNQTGDSPMQLAVGTVRSDCAHYLNAKGKEKFWLLGVDIGGTLTKCQLFVLDKSSKEVDFNVCGSVFHMSTKTPEDMKVKIEKEPDIARRAKMASEEYAKRLVALVKKRLSEHLPMMANSPLVIGITWPGPVRENHVAGTSTILTQFGLDREIENNKIDDIWAVDVAKAVKQVWQEEFHLNTTPFISLLNDGDADGVGAVVSGKEELHLASKTDRHVVSVVKLGTGLAGAVLDSSDTNCLMLRPGVYEWGKFVLDVGAPVKEKFPQGVAAEYLSKRCLPQLAAMSGKQFFKKNDEPDSAEIGLVFECAEIAKSIKRSRRGRSPSFPLKPYTQLISECGAIQAEKRPPFGVALSAEVYRLVYGAPKAEPDLIHEARLATHSYSDVETVLKETLNNFGRTRLDRLIGVLPVKKKVKHPNAITRAEAKRVCLKNKDFEEAAKVAEKCITSMGHYLGDFCVTLYDQLEVTEFRLTGGVLSNKTGEHAMKAACDRIKMYGLEMVPISGIKEAYTILNKGDTHGRNSLPNKVPIGGKEPKVERGSLGAASFSAAAFIQEQKQEELQKLRLELLPLPSGTRVDVKGKDVFGPGEKRITPNECALSEQDLLSFMEKRGPELRFFQTQDKNSFVKW